LEKAEYQKITDRRHASCVDCHMPYVSKNAASVPELFMADVRTHLMSINPRSTTQLDEEGLASMPYLTVEFACKGCHNEEGRGGEMPDEELTAAASGFHDPDQAGSLNRQRRTRSSSSEEEATPAPTEEAGEEAATEEAETGEAETGEAETGEATATPEPSEEASSGG
jgi:hypothetical protein